MCIFGRKEQQRSESKADPNTDEKLKGLETKDYLELLECVRKLECGQRDFNSRLEQLCNKNNSNILIKDDIPIVINSLITPKDVYENLWHCRDFELSHLWQRSVFLTAFLLLCFTGYGALVIKIIGTVGGEFYFLNLLAVAIAFVGVLFSLLWIKMGKASKRWYERYEKAIDAFTAKEIFFSNGMQEYAGFKFDALIDSESPQEQKGEGIFTTNGGGFSPSRINILIGQISFIIWIVLGFIHCLGLFFLVESHVLAKWHIGIGFLASFLFLLVVPLGNYLVNCSVKSKAK